MQDFWADYPSVFKPTYTSNIVSKLETPVKHIESYSKTVLYSVFWRFFGIRHDRKIGPTGNWMALAERRG